MKSGFTLPQTLRSIIPLFLIITGFTGLFYLVESEAFFQNQSQLSIAIMADLLFTLPIVFFWFLKQNRLPKGLMIPFIYGTIQFGIYILPGEFSQRLSTFGTFFFPLVELGILSFVGYKIVQVRKEFKKVGGADEDFMELADRVLSSFVSSEKVRAIFVSEMAMLRFALLSWNQRPEGVKPGEKAFTFHREAGLNAVLGAVLFVGIVELGVVHLLLADSYPVLAWVLLVLSVYSLFFIIGEWKASLKRRMTLSGNELIIRAGLRFTAKIPLELIDSVEYSSKDFPEKIKALKNDLTGNHNVMITLKKPIVTQWMYGINKEFQNIGLLVDDREAFKGALNLDEKSGIG